MTEANWQFLKVQVIDTPRSEDAGIIKDKLWGMNSPKFRFLKGKSDNRYPLAHG